MTLVTGGTEVLAAVKLELAQPDAGAPDVGTLSCSVDSWGLGSNQLRGKSSNELNAELSTQLTAYVARMEDGRIIILVGGPLLISGTHAMLTALRRLSLPHTLRPPRWCSILSSARAINTKSLCVIPQRYCWRVFVDCVVLEAGGSLLDALVLAATVALRSTRFPKLRLVQGEFPGDMDVELDDDEAASQQFAVEPLPVCLTFTQLAGASIVDASAEEEAVADSSVTIAINRCACARVVWACVCAVDRC